MHQLGYTVLANFYVEFFGCKTHAAVELLKTQNAENTENLQIQVARATFCCCASDRPSTEVSV